MYFILKARYYFIYVLILLSLSLCSLLSSCASSTNADEDFARISNLSSLIQSINAEKYHSQSFHCENMKIAVLDNGTYNISEHLGKTLPNDVIYNQEDENIDTQDKHGIILLETIYALCTGSSTYNPSIPGPKLYIYNTTGFSKLDKAIDKVISEKVHMVVYAQTWEFGGNLDGKGFINEKINKAIDSGIIWLNSIGNYRNRSFYTDINFLNYNSNNSNNSFIDNIFEKIKNRSTRHNGYNGHNRYDKYNRYNNDNNNNTRSNYNQQYTSVKLPYDNDKLLFKVSSDNTPVQIILAWSRFTDSILEGTDTDLDLFLEDQSGNTISISDYVQIKHDGDSLPAYAQANQVSSLYPMEKINTVLNQGTYVLKVKTKTPQLFNSNDKLWFAISSTMDVSFLNIDNERDSVIFIPADNPNVISISSSDCNCESKKSKALRLAGINSEKPEMIFPSIVKYSDNNEYVGSSTATAVAAASIGLYFSSTNHYPTKKDALNISKNKEFRLP